jgi:hypothetical protein
VATPLVVDLGLLSVGKDFIVVELRRRRVVVHFVSEVPVPEDQ